MRLMFSASPIDISRSKLLKEVVVALPENAEIYDALVEDEDEEFNFLSIH
jgi:hypothetical protein